MRVLVGRVFGIGNAVCSIPMIKAIRLLGHHVDVLVGSTPDDFGAREVFELARKFRHSDGYLVDDVHVDLAPGMYDLAIMSMPFDGRWREGEHFSATGTIYGKTRPDPSTEGFSSWKRHEVEYQMDVAREHLGFMGETPDCSFCDVVFPKPERVNCVYVGVGRKRDACGFWEKKHWGNENYIDLIRMILDDDVKNYVVMTGNAADCATSIMPIMRELPDFGPRVHLPCMDLHGSIMRLSQCSSYVGNDTGMMHAAASFDIPTLGIFRMPGASVKSRPWCTRWAVVDDTSEVSRCDVKTVFERWKELTR